MADWSALHSDLVNGIALKLDSVKDLVCFSAVCHSWNHVFSEVKPEWLTNEATPWLMLPEPNNIISVQHNPQFDEGCRKFFSIGKNKCYEFKLPQTLGARCWGTAYGWIVMLHLDKRIQLFNPITNDRLSLPPLQTMPNQPPEEEAYDDQDKDDKWMQQVFLHRFIVLKIPQKDNVVDVNEFVVMAIHEPLENLAFARPGDQAWTPVHTTCTYRRQVSDVFYWKGLVLILYVDGAIAYCDSIGTHTCNLPPIPVSPKDYLTGPTYTFGEVAEGLGELYMAELNGDLVVVVRHKTGLGGPSVHDYHTVDFDVYKLNNDIKSWVKVEDLGDFTLFVGNNTPMCVHESEATNCLRNAIYFTDDEVEFWHLTSTRGRDMGVFDMTSREFKQCYEGDDTICKFSPPTWFMPFFNSCL